MNDLREASLGTLARNIILDQALAEVVSSCRQAQIDLVALKGIVFAHTLYTDFGGRVLTDIDLLVKPQELAVVKQILSTQGYKPYPDSHTSFIRADGFPVMIDLHTELKYLPRRSMEEVWADSLPVTLGGAQVRMLSHEDTLVFIITHTMLSHNHPEAKWLKDADLFIRKYHQEVCWQTVIKRFNENHVHVPAYYFLLKIQQDHATPVPADILSALKPGEGDWLAARFFSFVANQTAPAPYIDYLLPVMVQPGVRAKIRFILAKLFPGREVMVKKYGFKSAWTLPIFYFRRFVELCFYALRGLMIFIGGGLKRCRRS